MYSSLHTLQNALTNARTVGAADFNGITTDSRHIKPGCLFVALRGEHIDAHNFIQDVMDQGAAAVVVQDLPNNWSTPALIVPDTRIALGEIATYWRKQFTLPLVGVTGSNGKTTVKEMIAAIFSCAYQVPHFLATKGNFNNDIGVPLTLFNLTAAHLAAVIELGMNHPGEIAYLASIAKPTVGIVNNAQREHQEFMESVEAVAKENGQVILALPDDGVAIFPADDTYTSLWQQYARSHGTRKIITFGLSTDATVSCTYTSHTRGSDLCISYQGNTFNASINAAGIHNIRNALAATATALALGISTDIIARGLSTFMPVNGRLQQKVTANNVTVIDDTYNANPDSVRAAIEVLAQAQSPRILVLGDMGEVGSNGQQFHEEIGTYAKNHHLDCIITLGDLARYSAIAFGAPAQHFDKLDDLHDMLDTFITPGATVLIKGSRFMKMERTVQHLLQEQIKEGH